MGVNCVDDAVGAPPVPGGLGAGGAVDWAVCVELLHAGGEEPPQAARAAARATATAACASLIPLTRIWPIGPPPVPTRISRICCSHPYFPPCRWDVSGSQPRRC